MKLLRSTEGRIELRHLKLGEAFADPDLEGDESRQVGVICRAYDLDGAPGRVCVLLLPLCEVNFYEPDATNKLVRHLGEPVLVVGA